MLENSKLSSRFKKADKKEVKLPYKFSFVRKNVSDEKAEEIVEPQKQEIVNATKKICEQVKNNNLTINEIDETIFEKNLYTKDIPPVDLLIRTSGEMRISNFLLWQIAYAEIIFTKVYWPDFHEKEFYEAIYEYLGRNRRFGGLEKSE